MYCKTCATYITFFNRQKCGECGVYFCSKCMDSTVAKCTGIPKLCKRCGQLLSGSFTRAELSRFTVKELRLFLSRRDVDMSHCCEKADLMELALHLGAPSGQGGGMDELEHRRHIQRLQENLRFESTGGESATFTETTDMTPPPLRRTRVNSYSPPATHAFAETPLPPMEPPNFSSFQQETPPPAYETVMKHLSSHPPYNPLQGSDPTICEETSIESSTTTTVNNVPSAPVVFPSAPPHPDAAGLSSDPIESASIETGKDSPRTVHSLFQDLPRAMENLTEDLHRAVNDFTHAVEDLAEDVDEIVDNLAQTGGNLAENVHETVDDLAERGEHLAEDVHHLADDLVEDLPPAESNSTTESAQFDDIEEQVRLIDEATATMNGAGASVPYHRARLNEIQGLDDIEGFTVKQLKALLVTHYVDYKGCCEKSELVERVYRLWKQHSRHLQLGVGDTCDEDLCKICMDAPIDCILLECGHMVTCTQCGKRMAECPICRTYVSRVVHVFKA